MIKSSLTVLGVAALMMTIPAYAQDTGNANAESLSSVYTGKA
jgi:hypothetical protein